MVAYIASKQPLPLIPWQEDAPGFNVKELAESEERVRRHFALPHIRYAGSHTGCGCGFNEGREYPDYNDPAKARVDALKSSALLADYIREHHVEQVYSCWSGDESAPKEFERHITPNELLAEDLFFRERELLIID
ncbi:MAG TPA: hypothetical protein VGJ73_22320 [Verrucomicrobiae bacterium]|jgi:hypothetical protein